MTNRVLIAYATRCGSTGEIAQVMAEEMTRQGNAVDVRLIKNIDTVNDYAAIIVGSAIRFGKWLPEATKFVVDHRSALETKKSAIFAVHGNNVDDSEESKKQRATYLSPIRAILTPSREACFGGVIASERMGGFEKVLTKLLKAQDVDHRNWNAIRSWAITAA